MPHVTTVTVPCAPREQVPWHYLSVTVQRVTRGPAVSRERRRVQAAVFLRRLAALHPSLRITPTDADASSAGNALRSRVQWQRGLFALRQQIRLGTGLG